MVIDTAKKPQLSALVFGIVTIMAPMAKRENERNTDHHHHHRWLCPFIVALANGKQYIYMYNAAGSIMATSKWPTAHLASLL